MEFLKSIDFPSIVNNILLNLDTELNVKISMKHRGFRNSISPSMLKLTGKTSNGKLSLASCRKQATHFFDPELLLGAKIIDYDEYVTLSNKIKNNASMALNCIIGNLLDPILVPAITKELVENGVWAIDQMPAISLETGVTGNADIIMIHEGKIYVLDLKTTGNKILGRANPDLTETKEDGKVVPILEDYQRQLYAYAKTFSIMFDLPVGGLALINICKTPASTITQTPEMFEQEFMHPYLREDRKSIPLPVCVMTYIDYDVLDKKYDLVLKTIKSETVKICHQLKEKYPSFDSWLINNELYELKLKQNEEIYNKRLKELGLD